MFALHSLTLFMVLSGFVAATKYCSVPKSGASFEQASPAEVRLNQTAVENAILYATTHGRVSVQIFRHNCLVATELTNLVSNNVLNNVWSCTKSVVSLLVGIAQDMGKLHVGDQIGKYLPNEAGWGDAEHRALTILQLLTETAGFREAIVAEASTVVIDQSAPQEALAQEFLHKPGTYFDYSQRVPDLLAYVVSRAVGQDLQSFAQTHLFDPIGIPSSSYFWLRDRSGNTYGYAWLFLKPSQLARLGLLTSNGGNWRGKQVVSSKYINGAMQSTNTNPCYGHLFWTNLGQVCTGANLPARQTFHRNIIPSAPSDLFAMVGALQQNNFIIPSLDMLVSWSGDFGDTGGNLGEDLSAQPGNLYNNFFSLLMEGVEDAKVPHTGLMYDDLNLEINVTQFFSPKLLLDDINSSPECNIVFCNQEVPLRGIIDNLQAIAALA